MLHLSWDFLFGVPLGGYLNEASQKGAATEEDMVATKKRHDTWTLFDTAFACACAQSALACNGKGP